MFRLGTRVLVVQVSDDDYQDEYKYISFINMLFVNILQFQIEVCSNT